MSITQKQGIIICLPKGDKPREFLKNWRPISLLNVTYKIGSSCIANRIKTVLPNLINEDQTGFISGRYIGDNLRTIYDIIHHLTINNEPGLLVSVDFEKAFDSLNWAYMNQTLKRLGFKKDICQWISTFYKNITSSIIVNGHISSSFPIYRGCRQGDPISPYIFILCVEALACQIRKDVEIRGINISKTEFKISQFADDTLFLLEGDRKSYEKVFKTLNNFQQLSGLKLNYEKTINVWIGKKRNSETRFLEELNMAWNPPKFKLLGLWFTNNLENMSELNFTDKFIEIKKLFNIWLKRCSTPLGRIAILKSLILSKLVYLWLLLPNPPTEYIPQLQNMCFDFIWDNKKDKIKRDTAFNDLSNGGIGIPNIKCFIESLKITWVKKMLKSQTKWHELLIQKCPEVKLMTMFSPHFIISRLSLGGQVNPFWRDVFTAYANYYDALPINTSEDLLKEPIFMNKKFKIDNKTIFYKRWIDKEILHVCHLINKNGQFMNLDEFNNKYSLNTCYLEYYGCISSIKTYMKKVKITIENDITSDNNLAFNKLTKAPKGTKMFYNTLLSKSSNGTNIYQKWECIVHTNIHWPTVFMKIKRIREVKLQWFQIKICHRILVTNVILKEMKIRENNLCTFCTNERDSIYHYLWDCSIVRKFWLNLEKHLKERCITCENLTLTNTLVLLGYQHNVKTDDGFDSLLLYAKYYIFRCKNNETSPFLKDFLVDLKFQHKIEENRYKIEAKYDKFLIKWFPYTNILM